MLFYRCMPRLLSLVFCWIVGCGAGLVPLPGLARAAPALPPATDTLRLTLPTAEQRFFQNNLAVLAQQYKITIAQAV